jgi:hypothetical protein
MLAITMNGLQAQNVGIGTNTPDPSAKLHLVDANRGLLIPQVSIGDISNAAPVTTPATGLLVWNNNPAVTGGSGTGFYYWDGSQWDKLSTATSTGTDDQNLTSATLAGNNLTIAIENGNPAVVDLTNLINDADAVVGNEYNTAFTLTGTILRLTDGGGVRTLSLASLSESGRNGLRDVGNFIHLGGPLTESTTITQGVFDMAFNLDNTGQFHVQSAGTNKFTVLDNGNSEFGGDLTWRDNSTGTGTILAQLIDDGDDGRFAVRENGVISIDLDANSAAIFNQQGLDRDFRVESANNANMFQVDANTDRIGIGTATPTETIHVDGSARITSLTGLGNRMVITDANGVLSTQAIPSGSAATADNGLNVVGSGDVHLGGTLIENTTITQGIFGMTYNLNSTGDFTIQDNGTDKFTVQDDGNSRFGGDVQWRDGNTGGTVLATMADDGDDGRFTVHENGAVSIDLDANGTTTFNEQGLDRDFRVESDANANMLLVDAGNSRIGVGLGNPSEALHVLGGTRISTGAVIGEHPTYGTHSLTVARTSNPSIQLGSMFYNEVEAGRLTFEERVPDYPAPGLAYCGFQMDHNGANNSLTIRSACPAETFLLTMQRNGDLGIGTDSPTEMLSVNGEANKIGGGTWTVFSDKRLKKDISDYSEGLSLITKVRTVNFSYNDKMAEIWGARLDNEDRIYQGVIAQELQKIAPDMVREINTNENQNPEDYDYDPSLQKESEIFLEVDPNKFTYALINAVKEQQVMIEQLKAEQANTKKELIELKEMLKK